MRLIKLSLLLLALSACTQTEPSIVNPMPMRTAMETEELTLNGGEDYKRAADMWSRGGQGPVDIVATYADGMEAKANANGAAAASRLRSLGVTDIHVSTVPAATTQVLANMRVLTAGSDASCRQLPLSGPAIDGYNFGDYRLGCTNDTMLGRQVAHTEDLEGRLPGEGYAANSDAGRQGTIVDAYRSGKPNDALHGLSASDIAGRDN